MGFVGTMLLFKGRPYSPHRRFLRATFRRRGSLIRSVLQVVVIFALIECLLLHRRLSQTMLAQNDELSSEGGGEAGLWHDGKPPRVFIASLHWNNEIILREFWNDKVVELVQTLGPNNVFVSVVESGSWDLSKRALLDLDEMLGKIGAPRNFTLDEKTHADEIAAAPAEPRPGSGWVRTSGGDMKPRRIPYLARLRNRSLLPLKELAETNTFFDYVLFLGDVYFTADDVLELLHTNNGRYAAACSLDFSDPPLYYDTFALRDADGQGHATQTWPYFRSATSRAAMKEGGIVPVTSCWNGIVSMPAVSFIGDDALAFRGVDDSMAAMHLEGSECCLIHADNPASATKGVYMNPRVRVGYTSQAYKRVHPEGFWLSCFDVFVGLWKNRLSRWLADPFRAQWTVHRRHLAWEKRHPGNREPGKACLIDEMQVLDEYGWAHV